MTIRDRIFEKLEELNMTQKEFSLRTGIPQTTVSDRDMVPGTFKKVLRMLSSPKQRKQGLDTIISEVPCFLVCSFQFCYSNTIIISG